MVGSVERLGVLQVWDGLEASGSLAPRILRREYTAYLCLFIATFSGIMSAKLPLVVSVSMVHYQRSDHVGIGASASESMRSET